VTEATRRGGLLRPALTLALVSASSMALEIVAGRALAPYVGMSLYSWTMIIAVVLAGLSLGHWIGGVLADRGRDPALWAAVALLAAAIATFVCPALMRWIEPLATGADPVVHIGLLALAFFGPSALAGILSPLLTLMAQNAAPPERQGRVLGLMFALGAFGAILGTLMAGLVMISWIGTAGSVMVIGITYAVLSLGFWRGRGRWIAGAAVVALAAGGAAMPERLGLKSPCRDESAYFCIRVDDIRILGREARVMALDHLAHGINDAADPKLLLTPYVHGVDELVRRRFPGDRFSAYFIGGGAYSLPRAWQAHYPGGSFVIAELDPAVTAAAFEALWFELGHGTEIYHGDARLVLSGLPSDRRFDVIFGDAFHDISIPQHLVTDEFHAQIAARLTPGGLYVLNAVDALRSPRFVLSLARTLGKRFAHVELWLDIEAVRPEDSRTTWIVLASAEPTPGGRLHSTYGFRREWVQVPLDGMIREVGDDNLVTLTDDYAPIDRLLSRVLLNQELAERAGGR